MMEVLSGLEMIIAAHAIWHALKRDADSIAPIFHILNDATLKRDGARLAIYGLLSYSGPVAL